MKRIWYLYRCGYNYGSRDRGIDAVKSIQADAGVEIPKDDVVMALQRGYCQIGDYRAVREEVKQ